MSTHLLKSNTEVLRDSVGGWRRRMRRMNRRLLRAFFSRSGAKLRWAALGLCLLPVAWWLASDFVQWVEKLAALAGGIPQ